jgi:hypothetical protein
MRAHPRLAREGRQLPVIEGAEFTPFALRKNLNRLFGSSVSCRGERTTAPVTVYEALGPAVRQIVIGGFDSALWPNITAVQAYMRRILVASTETDIYPSS